MTDDLVKRLRDGGFLMVDDRSSIREYYVESEKLKGEAADRIENLEAALRELSMDWDCCAVSKNMKLIARKALEGKDD